MRMPVALTAVLAVVAVVAQVALQQAAQEAQGREIMADRMAPLIVRFRQAAAAAQGQSEVMVRQVG